MKKGVLSAMVMSVVITATAVGCRSSSIHPTVGQPMLAFCSEREGRRDIYLLDVETGHEHRLTDDDELIVNCDVSWSPVARRFAYVTGWAGSAEIWTMDVEGGDKRRLTENDAEDSSPVWSPDGAQIAFLSRRGDGASRAYVMEADGSDQRLIVEDPTMLFGWVAWAPDGKKMFLISGNYAEIGVDTTHTRMLLIDMDTGTVEELRVSEGGYRYIRGAWSPDGKKLAYLVSRSGGMPHLGSRSGYDFELCVFDLYAGEEVRLSDASELLIPYWSPPFHWSPDGQRIVFTAFPSEDSAPQMYLADADGQNLIRLSRDEEVMEIACEWSPDGRWIAFAASRLEENEEIYLFEVVTGQVKRLTQNDTPELPCCWVWW